MFYKLDSTRASLREYWWGNPNPLVLIAWLLKLLRIRLPSSVDDPNVESLEPFRISPDQFPEGVRAKFRAAHAELDALGFHSPICYWIHDVKHQTDIYQAVYLHQSRQSFARIHCRMWHFTNPPKKYFFPIFLTAFTDGTYLISTAGKRDIMAPPACRENRHVGANATDLWKSHQEALQQELLMRTIRPVRDERELRDAIELHHATVRDFHVVRGVFVPMSEEEQQSIAEAAEDAPEAVAEGEVPSPSPPILEEIERLQNKRSGWGAALIVLLVSVGLFFGLGAAVWPWEFVAMLLPILFFHEMGHYAAMRLFHYSNVKMFFIPLLGAAVSGRHFNVPGRKKVIVSLAGPLPGIYLAAALGFAALWFRIDWLHHAAMLAIFLNAFNLLPLLPLDGGWVMHTLLFSRHYILDAGFRVLAVVVLLAASHFTGDRFLFFFGLFMAMGLPVAFRMAGVVTALRRKGISATSPDGQKIPPEAALAISDEIRDRFPQGLTNRNLAQFTLQAFEALNARPPGIVATILLGAVYFGSFLFALVAVGVLAIGMPMFARPDVSPKHPVSVEQIKSVGTEPEGDSPIDEVNMVATFSDADEAADRFDELKGQRTDDATILRFGQSILVAVPPKGPVAPAEWRSRLAAQTPDLFSSDTGRFGFSFAAAAPSNEVAARIEEILNTYQLASSYVLSTPPWHPDNPPTAAQQHARETLLKLTESEGVYDDPRYHRLSNQLDEAYENEKDDRIAALEEELATLCDRLREERLDKLVEEATEEDQRAVIELYQRMPVFEYEPEEAWDPEEPEPDHLREAREKAREEFQKRRDKWSRDLAELIGGVAYERDSNTSRRSRFGMMGALIRRKGRVIEILYARLGRPVDTAPAMARWFAEMGCADMKYGFFADQ